MAVLTGVQVVGGKMLSVFVPVALDDELCQLQFQSFDFGVRGGVRVGVHVWLLRG